MTDSITHRDESKPITKKRRYKAICDPGHGWMSVPHKDLIALDIVDDISVYSYINMNRAYLEEDADMSTFMNAAMTAGWQVTIIGSRTDDRSWVRSLASYNPEYIRNPIKEGGQCKILCNDVIMDVISMTNNRIYIGYGNDARHRINRNNPYAYISPV